MNHLLKLGVAMILLVGLVCLGSVDSQAAGGFTLKISVESTPGSATQYMLASFRDALQAEFGDEIKVDYYDSGTLGDEIVHMQQVRTGQLDVVPIGSDAVQLDNKWAVFDMMFLFSSREVAGKLLDGEIGQKLDASFQEKAGLKVLGFGEIGFRQITNNVRPIVVPADLKGLKLRTPGSKTRILSFKSFGAIPISMNIGELYLAMQQGVIDGQENPLGNIRAHSWYEVQKYISLSNHVYTPVTLSMNLARWKSLSSERQQRLLKAAKVAVDASRTYGAENDAKLVAEMKELAKGKTQFNEINVKEFQAAAKPVWNEIAKIAGQDFTNEVLKALGQ
jgi:tripartite ATP-independent transporter DctP family solute receptor